MMVVVVCGVVWYGGILWWCVVACGSGGVWQHVAVVVCGSM